MKTILPCTLGMALLLVSPGCGPRAASPGPAFPGEPATEPTPGIDEAADAEALARAIADASVAESGEEVHDLIALVPGHPGSRWRNDPDGTQRVLVVTWTNWLGYQDSIGKSIDLGREQWVTAVPEVQRFCQRSGLTSEALVHRLEQYLGLRPDARKSHFASFWVDPRQVVRPCPDPEVTDTTCSATAAPTDVTIGSHTHVSWFEKLKESSYGEDGYPWTRLGYTYDWGSPSGERGASEFLLPAGTPVIVESFIFTEDYCKP